MSEMLQIARAWVSQAGERRGALATVLRAHGSTFRRAGARMLIFDDATTVGSVSGGCLESSVIEAGLEVIDSGTSRMLRYDGSRDDIVLGEGAMCDGDVSICVEQIDPALSETLSRISRDLVERDQEIEIAVDGSRGARTRIPPTDPDGCQVMFQERLHPPVKLFLCGAGALADSVARLAGRIGWETLILDHRRHFVDAMATPAREMAGGAGLSDLLRQAHRSAIVVMTHHFERDRDLVEAALSSRPMFVGLLGSRARSRNIIESLPDDIAALARERLQAPVGLEIGSETIEEIALSIVSQIQAIRRGSAGGHLRDHREPIHGRRSARVAAAVLAAGASTRMGQSKLRMPGPSGDPLLREVLLELRKLELTDLLVVTGADPELDQIARDAGGRSVSNPAWQEGMSSSLRVAVDSLGDDVDALLVVLGDQPGVTISDLEALRNGWRDGKATVVATSYPEGGGVPAIFDRALFPELRQMSGDRGARDLIRSLDGVELVRLPDTRDVDDAVAYGRVIGCRPDRSES